MTKVKREIKSAIAPGEIKKLENGVVSKNGYIQGKNEVVIEEEKEVAPAWIMNKVNHSITLSYNGDALVMPPNGKEKIANVNLLGAIPAMISIVPIKK